MTDKPDERELPLADEYQAALRRWIDKCFTVALPEEQARCVEMAFYAGITAVLSSVSEHGAPAIVKASGSIMKHVRRMSS